MKTKGVWEIVLMSSMSAGRKVVGNRYGYSLKKMTEPKGQGLLLKASVKYQAKTSLIVMHRL
jgi:hypothetical protein